jgi:hypothetical protein
MENGACMDMGLVGTVELHIARVVHFASGVESGGLLQGSFILYMALYLGGLYTVFHSLHGIKVRC